MTKKTKILVIEDTLEIRENIAELLELSGFDVFEASNGEEGVNTATREIPDLILCDIMMPDMDGYAVLKILGQDIKTQNIPFVYLTAKTDKSDFKIGLGLGADDYITKPFLNEDLLATIRLRISKKNRIQDEIRNSEAILESFISDVKSNKGFNSISSDLELRRYTKKDVIYKEGEYPRWLYFIVEGSVKIYQTNELAKDFITKIFHPGDFFGYQALLNESSYTNTAETLAKTTLKLIPKNDFLLLLQNNKSFAQKFIKIISKSVAEIEKELIEMAYSSVRRKVAVAILACANLDSDKPVLEIDISREDLASKAGTAKETLIRTLSDFKSEKILQTKGSSIKILDIDKLKSMPQ